MHIYVLEVRGHSLEGQSSKPGFPWDSKEGVHGQSSWKWSAAGHETLGKCEEGGSCGPREHLQSVLENLRMTRQAEASFGVLMCPATIKSHNGREEVCTHVRWQPSCADTASKPDSLRRWQDPALGRCSKHRGLRWRAANLSAWPQLDGLRSLPSEPGWWCGLQTVRGG